MANSQRQKNTNGVIVGFMLSVNVLSPILSFIPNGIAILIMVPFFYLLYKNSKSILKTDIKPFVLFIFFILSYFLCSLLVYGFEKYTWHYLFDFILFGIPYILLPYLETNVLLIFRTLTIIGIAAIPIQLGQVDFLDTSDAGTWMMVSYNILKIAVASFITLFYDKFKLLKLISIVNILIAVIFLTALGSRGAILGCIAAILLLYIYRDNKTLQPFSSKFILISTLMIISIFSFSRIMIFISDVMNKYDIASYSLDRIVNSLNSGSSLSSGRDKLYETALNGIEENILFGQGIASFNNFSGNYPHNLIIQMLYEGGLFFGTPLILLTIIPLFSMNSKLGHFSRLLYIYLFSAGIVQLIFSSYFWMSILFWYWIGLGLKRIKI